ncbi:hypothetical protein FIBSPDRAFT_260873 [Athelia psychrophila]|uniref:Carbamoyl-phosphate synthetase large subunit-like ATP-binding domain-containing protein n=1 Tax=Athelia psychrophila TaxID=1759441 RepID=A0A166RQY3_9AGAM|nr:hypothetical protein FIBSPDRAFT_260873 [Fibularhizoctonia sp. CBS 109695]
MVSLGRISYSPLIFRPQHLDDQMSHAPPPKLCASRGTRCSPATWPSRRVLAASGTHVNSAADIRAFVEGGVRYPVMIKALDGGGGHPAQNERRDSRRKRRGDRKVF